MASSGNIDTTMIYIEMMWYFLVLSKSESKK